jgi:hypothetical protein
MTRKKNYAFATIDNETIEATKGNEGAFMQAVTVEVDGALNQLARDLSIASHRTGTGSRGQINATPNTVLTLKDANDIVNYELGQTIVASATDGTGTVKTASSIVAIDRVIGTITFADDVGAFGGGNAWATNDYLFIDGDYASVIEGFQSFVPYNDRAAKLAASFYGVVRSADATRLGGLYFDGTPYNMEEALIKAAALATREGAEPDYIFMNTDDVAKLTLILGSKVQRTQVSTEIKEGSAVKAVIGFEGLMLSTSNGSVKILGDRDVPAGYAHMAQMNTWKFGSIGPMVRLFEGDGLKGLRSTDEDAIEFRAFSYSNLMCRAPGRNMTIKLPA